MTAGELKAAPGPIQRALRVLGHAQFLPLGVRTNVIARLHSPVAGKGYAFETEVRGMRYAGTLASYVDWQVYFFGSFEPYVIDTLEMLSRVLTSGRRIAWDVGSNSGQHALMMSRHVDVVHAFEPWAPVREQLVRNVALNPRANIVVHAFGLADVDEMRVFHGPSERNRGVGAFSGGFMGKGKEPSGELPLRRGDNVVADGLAPPPGLIKIDVEGYEPLVLEGLSETIARHRPMIVLEYPALAYRTYGTPLAFVPPGYVHYAVSNRAVGPLLRASAPEAMKSWDAALVPLELQAAVEALAFYPQRV